MSVQGVALVVDPGVLPGRLREVALPDARVVGDGLALPGLTVVDVRGGVHLAGDRAPGPRRDGAPGGSPADTAANRAFGVVNVAWHLARGRAWVEALLGRPLPPLTVRIALHEDRWPHWSGGHYRLPAARYRLPEGSPAPDGEIHLGVGRRFLPTARGPLWNAPAHNPAIVVHEFGHHVVRHTADPRANDRAPAARQHNRKAALDEGTADYLAAALLGTPDIYRWQRGHEPTGSRRRRNLDAGWTMAAFCGGPDADPHADGSIWAGALWAARRAVTAATGDPLWFDALLLDALTRIGRADRDVTVAEARRRRRSFARGLEALLVADDAHATRVGHRIERAFAQRGIVAGASNARLRAACALPARIREPAATPLAMGV